MLIMRDKFFNVLCECAHFDRNIILVTGDLGFGVLDQFISNVPLQFINAGVAEQNMTGMAVGLALEGKIVFTYSIANFPTFRCLEQIRNDVLYHNACVNIVAVGGGLQRTTALSLGRRNSRGRGVPSDGSIEIEPISTAPKPSAASARSTMARN